MHLYVRRTLLSTVAVLSFGGAVTACQVASNTLLGADAQAASLPAVAPLAAAPAVALAMPTPGEGQLTPVPSLAPLVKRLRPVVVNINARFKPRSQRGPRGQMPPGHPQINPRGDGEGDDDPGDEGGDPMERFFRRFAPQEDNRERRGLGSGFLLGGGLVLTNNHVVQVQDGEGGKFRPMDVVKVLTDDLAPGGAREYSAKVLGADPKSDIALLRLDGEEARALPGAVLGDSDALEVGDYVVAIGEPFGLEATVTMGIVSAKERNQAGGPYSDYLQTDASINPGNSGGPLFNLRGEVVGVNSAIITGANTIGFAIPIAVVKQILPQLKDKGRVARGYLGVQPQALTRELADQLGLKSTQGALVADVMRESPAQEAGLKAGDVITAVNGRTIRDNNHLTREVGLVAPGASLKLDFVREGKVRTVSVKVANRPDETDDVRKVGLSGGEEKGADLLGLNIEDLTPDLARRLRVEPGTKGALVTDVQPDSPANAAGIEPGGLLVELAGKPIGSAADYGKVAKGLKKGDTVLARVRRGGGVQYLTIKIPR